MSSALPAPVVVLSFVSVRTIKGRSIEVVAVVVIEGIAGVAVVERRDDAGRALKSGLSGVPAAHECFQQHMPLQSEGDWALERATGGAEALHRRIALRGGTELSGC